MFEQEELGEGHAVVRGSPARALPPRMLGLPAFDRVTPGTAKRRLFSLVVAVLPTVWMIRAPLTVYESVVCVGWKAPFVDRAVTRPIVWRCLLT